MWVTKGTDQDRISKIRTAYMQYDEVEKRNESIALTILEIRYDTIH